MQVVHVNRRDFNSIDFDRDEVFLPLGAGEEFSFEIAVVNHGNPVHVHFSVSESLRGYVSFLRDNPYVRFEESIPVIVRMPSFGSVSGEIFVTVGYGSYKECFTLSMGEEEPEEEVVVVDVGESLSHAQPARSPMKLKARSIPDIKSGNLHVGIGVALIVVILILTSFLSGWQKFMGALLSSILAVSLIFSVLVWLVKTR